MALRLEHTEYIRSKYKGQNVNLSHSIVYNPHIHIFEQPYEQSFEQSSIENILEREIQHLENEVYILERIH